MLNNKTSQFSKEAYIFGLQHTFLEELIIPDHETMTQVENF